jgi:hypothetical protein
MTSEALIIALGLVTGAVAALWAYRQAIARRGRRQRGAAGEAKVARVLDQFAAAHRVRVRHGVRLRTRDGRLGDLDHVVVVGRLRRYIIAIETKAERPADRHYDQVEANARRASVRYFGGAPQYRIVVHPNSKEPVVFDRARMAARMGLPLLPGYLSALLRGEHRDRLARGPRSMR